MSRQDQDREPKRSINALKRIRLAWKYSPRTELRTKNIAYLNDVIKHKQFMYINAYQFQHKPKFQWGQAVGKRK